MKTVDKVNQFLAECDIKQHELNALMGAVGFVVGGVFGVVTRKKMHSAGMVKSFWLPGAIKKPGTYR